MKRFELVSHVYKMGTDRTDRGGLFRRAGCIIRALPKFDLLQPFPGARMSDTTSGAFRLVPYSPNQSSRALNPFCAPRVTDSGLTDLTSRSLRPNPIGNESNLMISLVYDVIRTGMGR